MPRDDEMPRWSSVTALASPHDVRVSLADASLFEEHDILRVTRTGEMMRVAEIDGGTALVRRGIASEPCPLEPGDEILCVGSAQ